MIKTCWYGFVLGLLFFVGSGIKLCHEILFGIIKFMVSLELKTKKLEIKLTEILRRIHLVLGEDRMPATIRKARAERW